MFTQKPFIEVTDLLMSLFQKSFWYISYTDLKHKISLSCSPKVGVTHVSPGSASHRTLQNKMIVSPEQPWSWIWWCCCFVLWPGIWWYCCLEHWLGIWWYCCLEHWLGVWWYCCLVHWLGIWWCCLKSNCTVCYIFWVPLNKSREKEGTLSCCKLILLSVRWAVLNLYVMMPVWVKFPFIGVT